MNEALRNSLSVISDCVRSIMELTQRVLANFSIEALDETIRQRSLLLARIEDEQCILRRASDSAVWQRSPEFGKIRRYLAAIASADREASARVTRQMETVRAELVSLDKASRAASSYTRNCRF